MLESMCQGGFLSKSATAAWEFLEDLEEKTMQWETARDDSLSSRLARGGMHAVSDVIHLESKIAVLENMLKGLSVQQSQNSQASLVSCSHCQALDHTLSSCPYFAHQLSTGQEHINMAYQRPKSDPHSPFFNPGWRNHPNFSWSSGPNAGGPTSQPGMFPSNNSQHISHSSNSFQRPAFQGLPNAPRPPPPVAQIQPPPGYTDIDKIERRLNNNMERMVNANMEKNDENDD